MSFCFFIPFNVVDRSFQDCEYRLRDICTTGFYTGIRMGGFSMKRVRYLRGWSRDFSQVQFYLHVDPGFLTKRMMPEVYCILVPSAPTPCAGVGALGTSSTCFKLRFDSR